MAERFHSKRLELPDPAHSFSRIDLAFYGVEHSGATFEAQIFLGKGRGFKGELGVEDPAYAGSFFVFGHGRCYGDPGHCEVPSERDPFDLRLPHHLEPGLQIVTVTESVQALLERGKSEAAVTVIAVSAKNEPVDGLSFAKIRLLSYA